MYVRWRKSYTVLPVDIIWIMTWFCFDWARIFLTTYSSNEGTTELRNYGITELRNYGITELHLFPQFYFSVDYQILCSTCVTNNYICRLLSDQKLGKTGVCNELNKEKQSDVFVTCEVKKSFWISFNLVNYSTQTSCKYHGNSIFFYIDLCDLLLVAN